MVTNPNFFSTSNDSDPLNQIKDAVDFPHSGLIKSLNGAMSDRFVISGCNITVSSSPHTAFTVATGVAIIEGRKQAITGATINLTNTQTNGFHLIVAPKPAGGPPLASTVAFRQSTNNAINAIPDIIAGDTIIAAVKYLGSGTAPEIQYLTADKKSSSLSIARDNGTTYIEGLTIQSNAGDIEIEAKESDKDIIFKVNDNNTPTEIMRIDGSELRVGIGTNAPDADLHIRSASNPTLRLQENSQDGYLDLIGVVDSQAKIQATNTTTNEEIILDIDADADGSGTQKIRFFRNSGTTGSSYIYFQKGDTTNTVTALLKSTTGQMSFGTNAIDANAMITVEGAISLDEISAPSNTADRGQLYTNADNHLHFINGAGTDVKVTEEVFIVALSDETTDLTIGNGKASFHMPFAMTLTAVKANCTTAPTGATIIVDINEAGTTIFSTQSNRPTIAIGATSANAAGIDDTALANDALITFDIDQIGSTAAGKGLKVTLYGYRA